MKPTARYQMGIFPIFDVWGAQDEALRNAPVADRPKELQNPWIPYEYAPKVIILMKMAKLSEERLDGNGVPLQALREDVTGHRMRRGVL